jgi:hypothetical protein
MKTEGMYDYQNIIDKIPPPGAEGVDAGNGDANEYMDTTKQKVPIDSKLSGEEEKVLKEAGFDNSKNKKDENPAVLKETAKPPDKKKGFLKRLFGKNKDKQ